MEIIINYSVFGANGGSANNLNHAPETDPGYGADVSVDFYQRAKIGAFYYDFVNPLDGSDPVPGERRAWLLYHDIWLVEQTLLWRSEVLFLDRKGQADIDGYYTKLKWRFHRDGFTNLRFDDMEDVTAPDLDTHRTFTLSLGYWPKGQVKARVEYASHRFENHGELDHDVASAWVGLII